MRISDWSSDVCSSDLAAGVAALGAVHSEEVLHLGQHAVEGPRLVAARRLDGVAVHRVAGPYHLAALALHGADERRQVVAHLVVTHAGDEGEAARLVLRIEGVDQPQDRKSTRLNSSH